MTEPYQDLANAIILMAVKDYRDALKNLKKRPSYKPAQTKKMRWRGFFAPIGMENLPLSMGKC